MKRIKTTSIIILTLVMCVTMAFPASAAVYVPDINDTIIAEVQKVDKSSPAVPSEYKYKAVFIGTNNVTIPLRSSLIVSVFVVYSDTQTINIGSTIYRKFKSTSGDAVTMQISGSKVTSIIYNPDRPTMPLAICCDGIAYGNSYYIENLSTADFYNIDTLNTGYDFIVSTLPDSSALQALISQAKSIQNKDYTQESWQALQTQIISAENLLATTTYTQAQIDSAKTALQSAIDGLAMLPDTTELKALVTVADTIQDDGYSKPTWSSFTTSRSSAHVLLASPIYTAPQVSNTTTELRTSMDNLRLLPDASGLQSLIETARTYVDDKYTDLSLQILNSKIMQALILLDNGDYVAAQIENMMSELWNAILGLVLIDNKPYEPPPIIVDGGHMWNLTPEQQKYANLLSGVKPEHLEPIKEAVEDNMGVARGYGLWVWFLVLYPVIGIIIVRGFLNNVGSNISLDMTHRNAEGGAKLTAWKRKERGDKHWEKLR